ncbi:DUF58 domain-containing protein [Planctomycetes bacterium K23_9]|uniref:DUF58 domain-containing protein n=1 Tax=Stieleria marina TaxID=1930275 RepID=A0A517NSY3_9BACT|nr:hypothetical protein K239x_21790 [Planctomycetes bacterium K23_9]
MNSPPYPQTIAQDPIAQVPSVWDSDDASPGVANARSARLPIRFTRLGLHCLFVAIFAMAGGAIRGFNLLLVLAGFLVAILIIQWRCSRRAIESLGVTRVLPDGAFAGTPFRVQYAIQNRSRWLNVWMIRVDDHLTVDGSGGAVNSILSRINYDSLRSIACGIGLIRIQQTAVATCDCLIKRRGRYRFFDVQLSTSFPFALLNGIRRELSEETFWVFPELLTLGRDWKQHLPTQSGSGAATARRSGVGEGEFYGLRPWQRGDSPRQIHWRTTARLGELAVRQTEESHSVDLCLVVDAYVSPTEGADASKSVNTTSGEPAVLETTLRLAATLAVQLSEDRQNQLMMLAAGKEIHSLGARGKRSSPRDMLRLLSDVEGQQANDLTGAIQSAWSLSGGRQSLVVLSTRSIGDALQASSSDESGSPDLSELLSAWRRRADIKWIDVSDNTSNGWFSNDTMHGNWGGHVVSGRMTNAQKTNPQVTNPQVTNPRATSGVEAFADWQRRQHDDGVTP